MLLRRSFRERTRNQPRPIRTSYPGSANSRYSRPHSEGMMRLQLAVITLALVHQSLLSQANPDSIKLRNDCRAAEHVLTTGEPGPLRTDALSIIGLCGREGIPALQAAWTSAGGDRTEPGPAEPAAQLPRRVAARAPHVWGPSGGSRVRRLRWRSGTAARTAVRSRRSPVSRGGP